MVTRIRQLLDVKQLTPTQFADFIGVGRPVMSHILSERNKPSLEVVQRIGTAFPDISLPWLMFGTGEMLGVAQLAAAAAASALEDTPAASSEVAVDAVAAAPTASPVPEVAPVATGASTTAPVAPNVAFQEAGADAAALPLPTPLDNLVAASSVGLPVAKQEPEMPPKAAELPPIAPIVTPAMPPVSLRAPQPAVAPLPTAILSPPVRAARFVPAKSTNAQPPVATPSAPTAPSSPLPAPTLTPPAASAPPATTPATPASQAGLAEATLLPFLNDSGKAIRRIVIFYRDGSFADYQPEG